MATSASFGINRISRHTAFKTAAWQWTQQQLNHGIKVFVFVFQYPLLYEHASRRHCKFKPYWIASEFFNLLSRE
jgi:hypothetical protein